jgi:peptide/nickel transport system substrate-binding protein
MTDKSLRAIGTTVILAGVAVAAFIQVDRRGTPDQISLAESEPVAASTASSAVEDDRTKVAHEEPFVYRLGVLASISTDNFWKFYDEEPSVWNAYILGPTKPALFAARPEDGSLRPELAATEVSPRFDDEGWRVRVPLSEDMTWSDGEPITAADFVFTFETVRALGLGGSWADAFPATIESVHADSPYELRIEFTERPGLALWPHAIGLAPVMPAHVWGPAVEQAGDAAALYARSGAIDVGGGPLSLTESTDTLVMSSANPGYPGGPSPDHVEYHVFEDEATAVAALSRAEIDAILSPKGLAESQLQTVARDPAIGVAHSPANAVRYLGFNLNRAPMDDKAFRTALALLLDREKLAEAVDPGASPAYAFVSPANEAWYDDDRASANANKYRGDLATNLQTALAALREAGYDWTVEPTIGADGNVVPGAGLTIRGAPPAPLTILTSGDAYDPSRPIYTDEIAGVLGWLGFDARPVETDFDSVIDLAFTPGEEGTLHYDMYLLGWTMGNPTLPGYYRDLFAPDGELNNTGYRSEAFNAQLAAYERARHHDEALEALWAMETTLAEDLPYLLLYTSQITEVYRTDRVAYGLEAGLGGLQGRLGAIGDVTQVP